LGILIPASWMAAIGITEEGYHLLSAVAGTAAGVLVVVGLAILVYRRLAVPRVAATTSRMDVVAYALLILVIALGFGETVVVNALGPGYDYRASVALWFRGLFVLDPMPQLMTGAPIVYQVHAISAWFLFIAWPFSRLVHAWSLPWAYFGRPWILFRRHPARRGSRRPI
jgi:nitrate reductase gamma subunit